MKYPEEGVMEVTLTARELLDNGKWEEVCDLKGINVWAINEGLMDETEEISLTLEEAKELGLIK